MFNSNSEEAFEFPVSANQATFWYMYQMAPDATAYSIPLGFRIKGDLDPERLRQSLLAVVARHEILRTKYGEKSDGKLVQFVGNIAELPFEFIQLDEEGDVDNQEELDRLLEAEFRRPILIDREPVLRSAVYKIGEQDYVFLLVIHHIAVDHMAIGLLLEEMAENYRRLGRGETAINDEPELHYADYVVWQNEQRATLDRQPQIDTWTKRLQPFSGVLELPLSYPRPRYQSFEGRDRYFTFGQETTDLVRAFSKQRGSSLFVTMLGCLMTVYQRYTRQSDIIVGTPFSDRNQDETLERVMGCFINTLPLAATLDENITFDELLQRINEIMMEAFDNQTVPLEDIVRALGMQRDVSRNPLFQVGFVFQDPPMSFVLPEAQVEVMPLRNLGAMYDIHTFMWDDGDRLGGLLTYNTELFDDDFVTRFLDTLEQATRTLIGNPANQIRQAPMLSSPDQELLESVNSTESDFTETASVVDLFSAQIEKYADKTAVASTESAMSYAELDACSTSFAVYLQSQGVRHGDLVGIGVDRGPSMLVALLGIWKAGAAYVPLDPQYPKERLAFMLETSSVRLLITQASLGSRMPDYDCPRVLLDTQWDEIMATEASAPMTASAGEDLAYVIFTSGSTGQPKGVQVPHRAVVNFLTSMAQEPGICAEDTLLAVTTLSFDIAVLELYLPICNGATTFIATADEAADGKALLDLMTLQKASIMQATPSTWRLLLAEGWLMDGAWSNFKVLCGGEAFPADLAKALTARLDNVWNMYGPTETTVWSAVKKLEPADDEVRIGRPIKNTQLHILNEAGIPVPVGVPGELHISGAGVTAGYLGCDDLSDASFFAHRLDPELKIYATGDLVRLHPDGNLEYLQRLDSQIKLRGFRIELGEIESVLADTQGVAGVVASIWSGANDDKRLVAYVIPDAGKISVIKLRKALRARLPDYMIPQHFVEVAEFPKTANGKIDRKALPSPLGLERSREKKPAETETEKRIAAIWSGVLGEASISRDDHFFDVGGHSLLAAEVIFLIEKEYGERLNPRMIVMHSLAEIAAGLDSREFADKEFA